MPKELITVSTPGSLRMLESIGEEHTKLNSVSFEAGIYLMVDVCFLFEIKMFGIKPFSSFPVQKYCVHSEKRLSLTEIFCAYHLNLSAKNGKTIIERACLKGKPVILFVLPFFAERFKQSAD